MKHLPLEQFRNWFGYTRRERRSTFILLLLILVIAGIRYIVPAKNQKIEIIPVNQWKVLSDTLPEKELYSVKTKKPSVKVRERPKMVLEINTCDSASLDGLPGIGPVLSARIIKFRNLLGGYVSVNQLREVYGLSEETLNLISGSLIVDTTAIRKININSADYKKLIRLPYFEKSEVPAILKYREMKGTIGSMKELVDNKIIPAERAERVRSYLDFR
jgi:DNA uptake protein ComE-like DNA-binding protein